MTLINARAPILSVRTKITQTIHNEQTLKSKASDLLSGSLNLGRKRCVVIYSLSTLMIGGDILSGPPRRVSFPLKAVERLPISIRDPLAIAASKLTICQWNGLNLISRNSSKYMLLITISLGRILSWVSKTRFMQSRADLAPSHWNAWSPWLRIVHY